MAYTVSHFLLYILYMYIYMCISTVSLFLEYRRSRKLSYIELRIIAVHPPSSVGRPSLSWSYTSVPLPSITDTYGYALWERKIKSNMKRNNLLWWITQHRKGILPNDTSTDVTAKMTKTLNTFSMYSTFTEFEVNEMRWTCIYPFMYLVILPVTQSAASVQ